MGQVKNKSDKFDLTEITIDESLNKFKGKNMFPEKLRRANEILEKYGLPKEIEERTKQKK